MTPKQFKKLFPYASKSLIAANAQSSGLPKQENFPWHQQGVADSDCAELERHALDAALGSAKAKAGDSRRFFVRVTRVSGKLLDQDNLCEKLAVDCCRYAGLIPGDTPGQTRIEAAQRKAEKGEEPHTLIEIFQVNETL